MTNDGPYSYSFRTATLPHNRPIDFDLVPDAPARAAIARALGLLDLTMVRLKGEIRPAGQADYDLVGVLSAELVQSCVATLEPVSTRLHENVLRRYRSDFHELTAPEIEMPEDDSVEALGDRIDCGAVLVESLALAVPLYPRVSGAQTADAPSPGPDDRDRQRPFAGLADLLKKPGGPTT